MNIFNFSRAELPKISENVRKNIVEFGSDNLFPNTLIEALSTSAIHNAIVESKAKAITGKGVELIGNVSVETKALFEQWIMKPNQTEDLEDLLNKVSTDYETFGAFSLEVIWTKDGKNIAEINHIDVSKIRMEFMTDGVITHYQYSRDWAQTRKQAYTPVRIPAFNPANAKSDKRQLLYVKNYRAGNEYYGVPAYIAATSWIQLDAELGLFHLSNIKNGLTPSMHFNFRNGTPTEDEQHKIYANLKTHFQGSSNAGKFIVTYSDGEATAPEFKAIETSNVDELYIVLNDLIIQNILTAHRVTSPMLLGVKTEGQLGGSSELSTAYTIFDKTVIAPSRQKIQKTFNQLLQFIIPGAQMNIIPANPIEFTLSESTLTKIMSVNELRAKISLKELTDEELQKLKSNPNG